MAFVTRTRAAAGVAALGAGFALLRRHTFELR